MSFGKKRFYKGDCSEVYRKMKIVNFIFIKNEKD